MTNINDTDLNLYVFDYDLTMAIALAHWDGTVYHRYGGRSDVSPMRMETLLEILEAGLVTHAHYVEDRGTREPPRQSPLRIRELVETQLKGRMRPVHGCYHCHYVREAKVYLAARDQTWTPDQFWIWPSPRRLGLIMNQDRQYLVDAVVPGSAAQEAGIRKGDLLNHLNGQRVLTKYDIQWILDRAPNAATSLDWEIDRDGETLTGTFHLGEVWKVGDPREYDWRVRNVYTEHMRKVLPTPGLAGAVLSREELRSRGLEEDRFALQVTSLNGGIHLAGIRLGDIILGAGNEEPFESPEDFFRFCELRRRAREDIKITLLRGSNSMQLMVNLNYLNYTNVSESPEAVLGFIAQELAGGGGLRVGNVTAGSNAEETGLQHGDRILLVDDESIRTFQGIRQRLDNKAPGEILRLEIKRGEETLQFAYVLMGKESARSEIAELSAPVTSAEQIVHCTIVLPLETGQHIYSAHHKGLGLPTSVEFRGRGYSLAGSLVEPPPTRRVHEGLPDAWVLEGTVRLRQAIRVTDPENFRLIVRIYAQVCDAETCHELRDVVFSDGRSTAMVDFQGDFESSPPLTH